MAVPRTNPCHIPWRFRHCSMKIVPKFVSSADYCERASIQPGQRLCLVRVHWQSGAVLECCKLALISASSQGARLQAGEPSVKMLVPIDRWSQLSHLLGE